MYKVLLAMEHNVIVFDPDCDGVISDKFKDNMNWIAEYMFGSEGMLLKIHDEDYTELYKENNGHIPSRKSKIVLGELTNGKFLLGAI